MCYNRHRRLENSKYRTWTEADERKIMELVEEYGDNWKKIKTFFPTKN